METNVKAMVRTSEAPPCSREAPPQEAPHAVGVTHGQGGLGEAGRSSGSLAADVLSSQSWWWYDELLEPCVSILDFFEFLAVDDAICSGLARVLQSALVAMTASSAEDGVKRMMQAVLEKTRSEDAEVVLMALKCAHRIWSDLGIQVVMSLSEVVMYTSELQDHEAGERPVMDNQLPGQDSRVETEVKAMVRTIEDCTGESLHDAMKT
eukprot:s188_g18.t1